MEIGIQIKQRRIALGFSQEELADLVIFIIGVLIIISCFFVPSLLELLK